MGRELQLRRESWIGILLPLGLILGLFLLLRSGGGSATVAATGGPYDSWLKVLVGYVAAGAEIVAAFVVGVAGLEGFYGYARSFFPGTDRAVHSMEAIRLKLGRALALGLEFTIASDILRTAVAPTPGDIMNLAAIIILRTLLNYFLEQEIRVGEERDV